MSRVWVVLATLAALAAAPFAAHANSNPRYSAFIMHADTGDALFSRYADSQRYPASITKVMTLYLLFEAIEAGDVSVDDTFTVSKRAAGQAPSKLGLKAGEKVSVETLIHALVVRSANDAATVVGEALGGTEYKFSLMMTERARSLGMRRTTFRNASGLPDRRQKSTARDLATLAQRTLQDFPQYFEYFDDRSFEYKGRTYRTHNRLVLNYDGATGLKTGYTRWSGYNLVTTAQRDEHRLIGVVLGGRSTRTRDRHMENILDAAYASIEKNPASLRRVLAVRPTPSLKPTLAAQLNLPQTAPISDAVAVAAAGFAPGQPIGAVDEIGRLIADLDINQDAVEMASVAQGDSGVEAASIDDKRTGEPRFWNVQVGAYHSKSMAFDYLDRVASAVGGDIVSAQKAVSAKKRRRGYLYRARFTGFGELEAEAACLEIKKSGFDCFAIRDPSTRAS